ncbi:MAG TPA: hypothetical protein VGM54_02150 [Chthoniobacter sp.]|jgi:hypothetical protein
MRDYADKLADAAGAGYDSYTAMLYARGSFRLAALRPPRPIRRSEDEDETKARREQKPDTQPAAERPSPRESGGPSTINHQPPTLP